MRLLSDIAWIILLTITPWWLFERLLLSDCERAVCKRLEALEEAERILGSWAECMPKYLRRGPKED